MVLSDGHTVLHEAAQGGDRDTVRYLLSVGANPQAQDEVWCINPPCIIHVT
jgi:ankyrin repeat protein